MTRTARPWPCIVVRRQHPNHPRAGEPMRWIAGCQNCGLGAMGDQHGEVMTWAEQHVGARCGRILNRGSAA